MRYNIALLTLSASALAMTLSHADDARTLLPPIDATEQSVAPLSLPTPVVMHAKLRSTQQVLAGLLQEDYDELGSAARELRSLARDVPTRETEDVEADANYAHFRFEMLRRAEELEQMAEARNLAGAAYVHQQLTAACISCHRHVRQPAAPAQLLLFSAEVPEDIRAQAPSRASSLPATRR